MISLGVTVTRIPGRDSYVTSGPRRCHCAWLVHSRGVVTPVGWGRNGCYRVGTGVSYRPRSAIRRGRRDRVRTRSRILHPFVELLPFWCVFSVPDSRALLSLGLGGRRNCRGDGDRVLEVSSGVESIKVPVPRRELTTRGSDRILLLPLLRHRIKTSRRFVIQSSYRGV